MREGWAKSTVADVCEVFTDGNWIESKDQSPDGIRLVQTGNVGSGNFKNRRDKARFISQDTFERLKCFEIFASDCLISRLPDPVGRACLIPDIGDRMITAVDCSVLRFKQDKIAPEFFNYYAQSADYLRAVDSSCSGATRKRISRKNLGKVEIPLPPLAEQKRIVALLDEAFAGIAVALVAASKNLKNARELFETTLNTTFTQKGEGWVEATILDVCETIVDCVNRTAPKSDIQTEYKMIRTTNVRHGKVNLEKVNYVTEDVFHDWTRRQLPRAGDVILTREAPMGEVGVLETNDKVFLGQRLVSYRVDTSKTISKFIYYQMRSSAIQDQIRNRASGSIVQHMRVPDSKSLVVIVPGIETQKKLCEVLDTLAAQTQRLEALFQQKIDALKELKQSLLQRAFAGELTADPQPLEATG